MAPRRLVRWLVAVLAPFQVAAQALPPDDLKLPGDAERGRALVADRHTSLCTLCHAVPGLPAHLQGNLGPSLAGVGARLDGARLRVQLVQPQRLNPETIMPAYRRSEGFTRVGVAWQGRPLFSAQQLEDVLAYLQTLR